MDKNFISVDYINSNNNKDSMVFDYRNTLSSINYNISGYVPKEYYKIPIGKCNFIKKGKFLTIVTHSFMVIECLKCVNYFSKFKTSD